jgi:hypothetical protein
MIGSIVIAPPPRGARAVVGRARPLVRARFGLDPPVERVGGHRVHAEGLVELAQQVVRREVAVLQLFAVGPDLVVDELAHGLPDHLHLVGRAGES